MVQVSDPHDLQLIKGLTERHVAETGSSLGKKILSDWDYYSSCFKKILPRDYTKMLALIADAEMRGLTAEEAKMEAFKKFTSE